MRALKVLFLIWTNPRKGLARKRVLQRDAFEGETYYEAVPTTAILTAIWVYSRLCQQNPDREPISLALTGHDSTLFLVTFLSSILCATFGLSKALITGPCKIFPGTSLFSGRLLLLVVANLLNLLGLLVLLDFLVTVFATSILQVNSPLKSMIIFVSNDTSGAK